MRRDDRYGVVVIDGDTVGAGALVCNRRALRDYLNGGGWVLALDATPADFSRVFDGLTGFAARPVHGRQGASVFMFREAVVHGVPNVQMLDDRSLVPLDAGRLPDRALRMAIAEQARQVAATLARRLEHPDTGIRARARTRQAGVLAGAR